MAKLKVADFYYGAVLSVLFTNHINPALIEGGIDRQVYDFTTDNADFRLFVKYRANKNDTKKEDYYSWNFNLTDKDLNEIKSYIGLEKEFIIALVCGVDELSKSEIILLNKGDISDLIIDKSKSSLSISRKKGERAFRISVGGGRENAKQIKANRFEEMFKIIKSA